MSDYAAVIVGAGMAGASLAAELASGPWAGRPLLLLEMEHAPGYHATGRSAAFWDETYGGPQVQPLTSASEAFLARPPASFAGGPFLSPRGALVVADGEHVPALADFAAQFADSSVRMEAADRRRLEAAIPRLKPGWDSALALPDCQDIDVAGLHAAYLRAARRGGVELRAATAMLSARRDGAGWTIATPGGEVRAPVLVNAAGAWADAVARAAAVLPIGITAYRRTLVQLRVDAPVPAALPLVIDVAGRFYVKGEGPGRVWLSPHDEHACDPCDAAPEELDVATAIDRLETLVDWPIAAVERKWAGLRAFAPDRLPVVGFDALAPGFFWFAGQGGFGIQTAPAMAALAGGLIAGGPGLHAAVAQGIDGTPYLADRFPT